jgi:hypothetical protein
MISESVILAIFYLLMIYLFFRSICAVLEIFDCEWVLDLPGVNTIVRFLNSFFLLAAAIVVAWIIFAVVMCVSILL